uniref:Uncharacterized protein n=1 Tax=Xenopus tropicalis TaxID=8364 RepID=A0A1B8Y7T2_XENTR
MQSLGIRYLHATETLTKRLSVLVALSYLRYSLLVLEKQAKPYEKAQALTLTLCKNTYTKSI